MIAKALTELSRRVLTVAIDTGSNGALVRKISGDLTLVLLVGSADEGRVEDETVLGSLTFSLKSTEQCLLGTQNLDRRCRVLG